jgi:galactitol-specific phosphotransferase system IIC component
MNRQKMIIGAALFLAVGIGWIISFWHGDAAFAAAHPVAGSKFSLNIEVTGWPALGGFTLTVLGAALLLLCAVLSVVDLATARRA